MQTKGSLFGSRGLEKAGNGFLTVGIIELLMRSATWVVGQLFEETLQTMHLAASGLQGEVARDEYSRHHERLSTRFMVTIASLGIVAFSVGLVPNFGTPLRGSPFPSLVLPQSCIEGA